MLQFRDPQEHTLDTLHGATHALASSLDGHKGVRISLREDREVRLA